MPRNESSRSAGKRPMRAMTPQEKMDAIGRVHAGESKAAVARDIGVPESTLRGWCKAEDKIRAQLNNVRTTGTYDHILTSSSENSDNSRAGSSSRSTPTQNTMGMSTCGVAERVNEEPEAGPAPKRPKMDNNLSSVAAAAAINMNNMNNLNNMSTSARTPLVSDLNPLLNPTFLYNILTLGDEKTIAAFTSFMTRGASSSHSGYLAPAVNLESLHRNNGAMGSTMAMSMGNMLPTSNALINGKRRYNTHGIAPTAEIPPRVTARRQNNQSPNAEKPSGSISQPTNNRASPMPSTSASNGSVANNSKSSKDCKKLHDVMRHLQRPVEQSECNIAEILATNAMNNNNNNVDHVDNENSLPPEFAVVLEYGNKFADWLQKYGSAICTFRQVCQIRDILKNMSDWAESKEIEPKENSNGTS